jgi:hypothetical protein
MEPKGVPGFRVFKCFLCRVKLKDEGVNGIRALSEVELSTGLVRQQRKASSHKSPCRKHNTWLHSQGNLTGNNMASQYTGKSARFLHNCNALGRNFQ